jgi:putative peptide zinc metalloprotease protein
MRFGPTSLQLTTVLAKGLRRPKLRADLKVSEQTIANEKSYVIKIPETASYSRYAFYEYSLLRLCDGTRTTAEISQAMRECFPDRPLADAEVVEFLDGMDPNAWERSLGERNLAILEKIREERKARLDRSSLLYIYFSAWDPDKLLERIHPYLRWLFTRGFAAFSIALFLLAALIVCGDFTRIRQDTVEFYSFTGKSAYDIWIFWVLLFFVSGIHEFGHGLTCKHFGGEVHQMGFMLIYFTPSFYTDCTDMHMFDRMSKRLWTVFAGIWVELVLCSLATLVWFFSLPGSLIGDLGYKTLLLTGVSGVFFNLNPLMKFDGYFALSQYLEIDNLRDDSFNYLKVWARRTLLRSRNRGIDPPPVGWRKRRIFLGFGLASVLYSALVLIGVALFARNVFAQEFGILGYPVAAGALYLMLRKRLRPRLPAVGATVREVKEKLMAWKMTRLQQVVGGAIVVLVAVLPTATEVRTDFVLEPSLRAQVRAPVEGWISEVRARESQPVEAGRVLAVLRNPELEARATILDQDLAEAERALVAAQGRGDLGEAERHARETQRLQAELAADRDKVAGLVLRAPLTGIVTTAQVEQHTGEYLAKGAEFAMLVDRRTVRARVLVRDWELEDVREGAPVRLVTRANPFRIFSGRVQQIMPAATGDRPVEEPKELERQGQELTNYFAVVLEFPNPNGVLCEGMTGTAKIYGRSYPLAWRVGRGMWRWLRSQAW